MMNRRSVLKALGLTASLAAARGTFPAQAQTTAAPAPAAQAPAAPTGPFTLPPLPYAYEALEPYFDAETMHIHHDKHHAAYVKNLNAAVAGHPELAGKSVDELVASLNTLPEAVRTAIRNQGGGHANHSFWWQTLSASGGDAPKAELAKDIDSTFGSFSAFQEKFSKAAGSVFGSGWAWLTFGGGNLQIETTPNQDSVLTAGRTPILGVDVWEHAYYLKYQNRRPEYLGAFFHVVNWDYVSGEYAHAKSAHAVTN
ncbi:MAG TPA: superoxide dismutase [Terracidiphilus sp.]|jgi:Fe-Mn family superoxide dismutase|nr:superoxide dismutase [Terracidiphilus sp.]